MKNVKHTVLSFLGIVALSMMLISCYSLWDDLSSVLVTFNGNNGIGTMEPQIFVSKVPQTINENKFTREGYTFAGWATSADASTAEFADKANFTATKDTTFYAIWNKIPPTPVPLKYTITYVSDKGTLPEAKTVEQGYKLTADDLPALTETGYNFKGWNKSVGDVISSDTTITATWKKLVTITYASNKSELNDKLPASKTVDEGYKLTADDLSALTADGYNFKGWDKSVGDEIKTDVTITATWKKVVTISYSSTYGTKPENKTVEEGYKLVAADLPNVETDTQYGEWDKTVGTEITADTTITANWEDIVYLDYSGDFKSDFPIPAGATIKSINIVRNHTFTDTPIGCAAGSVSDYFSYGYETEGNESTLWISGNGHRIYAPEDSNSMFYDLSSVTSIDINNLYTSKVKIMDFMFSSSSGFTSISFGPNFDTLNVESMECMFQGCNNLESLDVSGFNTSKVTTMVQMFEHCEKLETLDLSSFNTEKVTNMNNMFNGCIELKTLDVSGFDTSSVTNMNDLFYSCVNLTSLDLSSFDTSSVTSMSSMFYNCKALTSLDVSSFDTSSVENMRQMFNGCSSLSTLDISSFDTSSVKWTSLGGCGLSIFNGCSSLVTIYASDKFVSTAPNLTIFDGCTSLVGGTGTKYSDAETSDPEHYKTASYARIDTDTTPGYFTLKQ